MKSATRLIKVETRAIPNSAPHPSIARTSLTVQELRVCFSCLLDCLLFREEAPEFRWLFDQCVEEFMALDPGSEPLRERKLSPVVSSLERRVLELRKSASKRLCSDLSYQTTQTRPAGGVSDGQGSWTCLMYAVRMTSNVFKFRHPQSTRHRLANGYFNHISR